MIKYNYYKITEELLKKYKYLKEWDLDKKKIDIAIRSLSDREFKLFELLYCSSRNLSWLEISNIMNISKSTYYCWKKSLISRITDILYL